MGFGKNLLVVVCTFLSFAISAAINSDTMSYSTSQREAQLRAANFRAGLKDAKAESEKFRLFYDSAIKLKEAKAISKSEFQIAKSEYNVSVIKISEMEKRIAEAEADEKINALRAAAASEGKEEVVKIAEAYVDLWRNRLEISKYEIQTAAENRDLADFVSAQSELLVKTNSVSWRQYVIDYTAAITAGNQHRVVIEREGVVQKSYDAAVADLAAVKKR